MAAKPPLTTLRQPGPVFSMGQTIMLLAGAAREGYVSDDYRVDAEDYAMPVFKREYQDLLAAILLFGPGKMIVPSYFAEEIEIEPLLEHELAEVVDYDGVVDARRRAALLYERAFNERREVEVNPLTSPVVSLDAPHSSATDYIDAETHLEEHRHFLQRLIDFVDPLVNGLEQIFGYHLHANARELTETLEDLNERAITHPGIDGFGDPVLEQQPERPIFEAMGLYPADALEFDRYHGLSSYLPDDLKDFARLDANLTDRSGRLADHLELGMSLGLRRDVHEFFSVHCFWRSFFELLNMLRFSDLTANPLFVPGSALPKGVHRNRSRSAVTTDELIRVYRLVIRERGLLPTPSSIDDLLRMRDDRRVASLRHALTDWSKAFGPDTADDINLVASLREEIAGASKSLRRAEGATRLGTVIGYVALPVAVAEYLSGAGPTGLALAAAGPAVSLFAQLKLRKVGWVRLGGS